MSKELHRTSVSEHQEKPNHALNLHSIVYYNLLRAGVHVGENRGLTRYRYGVHKRQERVMISLEQTAKRLLRAVRSMQIFHEGRDSVLMLINSSRNLSEGAITRLAEDVNKKLSHNTPAIDEHKGNSSQNLSKLQAFHRWKHGHISNQNRITQSEYHSVFFLSVKASKGIEAEAARSHIPSYGICDSDTTDDHLTYVIPGSDNSLESLTFYGQYLHTILTREEKQQNEIDTEEVKDITEGPKDSELIQRILQDLNL